MKYLRRFNESKSDDFADYLYSLFEVEPDEVLQGQDWYFGRWYWSNKFNAQTTPQLKNLDQLLKSKRFSDLVVIKSLTNDQLVPKEDWEIFWDNGLDILIVSPQYYNQNSKWLVSNIKWERHPMAIELDKHKELQNFAFGSKLISDKAAYAKGLPLNCSLIKGMRFGDGLEFWPQKHTQDPIYVETDVELQALIYKYICDEKTNEGLFDLFKKSAYKSGREWITINLSGIEVHLQPGVKVEKSILNPAIEKLNKLSQRWYLIQNRCEVYANKPLVKSSTPVIYLKFRLSDCEGGNQYGTEGQIPEDIKSEIISDFYKLFGKNGVEVDEFPDRGYLIFDVCIKL